MLQNRGVGMGPLPSQSHHPFLPHPIIPQAPHSAPANIAFGTYPMQTDLDFNEISPLTSPWLGAAYGGPSTQASDSITPSAMQITPPATGGSNHKKRRTSSPGSDEHQPSIAPAVVSATGRPSRKRQSSTNRLTPTVGPVNPKKSNLRGTKSANSTPLFPPTSSTSIPPIPRMISSPVHRTQTQTLANDIPGDTPSPVDLSMPPPAPPAGSSLQFVQGHSTSPAGTSGHNTPNSATASPEQLMPVTPASIMNLGRLGTSSSLTPPSSGGQTQAPENVGKTRSSRNRASTLNSGSNPTLKPILPGKPYNEV